MGKMDIIYTGGGSVAGSGLPDDDVGVEFSQLDFALEKHPRYAVLDKETVGWCKAYAEEADPLKARELWLMISAWDTNNPAISYAAELAEKLRRNQTSFSLSVPVYTWSLHFWDMPAASGGGFEEVPYGPIDAPAGFVWMRWADSLTWTGQHWKLTRRWQACKEIDSDIYPVPLA